MIEEGDRVLLVGEGREFFVKAGQGKLGTDKGQIELASLVGKCGGDVITSHSGAEFTIRIPRPTDFFTYGKRSGAPMLPKDIGLVIAYTGMNHNDDVLDAAEDLVGCARPRLQVEVGRAHGGAARDPAPGAAGGNQKLPRGTIPMETRDLCGSLWRESSACRINFSEARPQTNLLCLQQHLVLGI